MSARQSFVSLDGRTISYELVQRIGSGGFGIVHLAKVWLPGTAAGKRLAIKKIWIPGGTPALWEKAVMELKERKLSSLLELNHKNLVQYFAAGACPPASAVDSPYALLIMEYCPGGTLEDLIFKDEVSIPHHTVYDYSLQTLRGLAYLHSKSRIHTDLKSSNILFTDNKTSIKIGDYDDCLKLQAEHTVTMDVTQPHGTVRYMSPEMILSRTHRDRLVGRKTDIWSLGCVILEMLSSERPKFIIGTGEILNPTFESMAFHFKEVQIKRSSICPEIPSDLPLVLRKILDQCLRVEVEDRPYAEALLSSEEARFEYIKKVVQDLNSGDPHEVLQGTKNLPVLISNEGILPAASVQSAVSRGILAVQQYLNDPEQQKGAHYAIASLVESLQSGDNETVKHTSMALTRILKEGQNFHGLLCESGVLVQIQKIFRTSLKKRLTTASLKRQWQCECECPLELEVCRSVLDLLNELCRNDRLPDDIDKERIAQMIEKDLNSAEPIKVLTAIAKIGMASRDILLIVDELKNTTVMKELVDLLRVPIMQEAVLIALEGLLKTADLAECGFGYNGISIWIAEAGLIKPLVTLLSCNLDDVQQKVLRIVGRIVETLVAVRGMVPFSPPVSSPSKLIEWNKFSRKDAQPFQIVLRNDVIKEFITLLCSKKQEVQIHAAKILKVIAAEPAYIPILTDHGAITAFMDILNSGQNEVQNEVAGILLAIANDPTQINKIIEEGATASVIKLLSSTDHILQIKSASAIIIIADKPDQIPRLVSEGAIPPLIAMLTSSDDTVQAKAAWVLGTIAEEAKYTQMIIEHNTVQQLVTLLSSNEKDVQQSAARCIGVLCGEESNVKRVVHNNTVPLLSNLLSSKYVNVQEQAAFALSRVASVPAYLDAVVNGGAVQPLVRLLHCKETRVQRWVMETLGTVADADDRFNIVIDQKGFRSLLDLLDSKDKDIRRLAAWAIGKVKSSDLPTVRLRSTKACKPEICLS